MCTFATAGSRLLYLIKRLKNIKQISKLFTYRKQKNRKVDKIIYGNEKINSQKYEGLESKIKIEN
ncbi:hypothetical protein BpHYR1_005816 [Brachionus plicatilis]|uniref:Uncharacterized protein n=1 Tax=Brachionus plicatilis TaxID=10195 RepID=A0A3M7QE38_BRAPC|nr:hypothetical protein BpHYR1_005816 [Brachionus plicatilis]